MFADAMEGALKKKGIKTHKRTIKAVKKYSIKLRSHLDHVVDNLPGVIKLAGKGISLVAGMAKFSESDVKEISELLGDKRAIVLIDDLDRANPKIVPELLLATREVLDMCGFSYIMAFDPEVVVASLGDYHNKWGDNGKFLEKIIDFPRWIPIPATERIIDLTKHELRDACPGFDLDALDRISNWIPSNPRKARAFVRCLWTMREQVGRFQHDEFQWELIYLSSLLSSSWPRFFHLLLNDEIVHKEHRALLVSGIMSRTRQDEKSKEHLNNIENRLEQLWMESEGYECDKAYAIGVAREIVRKANNFRDSIGRYSFFVEGPLPITLRECREMVDILDCQGDKKVNLMKWLDDHMERWNLGIDRLKYELIEELLLLIDSCDHRLTTM